MKRIAAFFLLAVVMCSVLLGCQKTATNSDSGMEGVEQYSWPSTGLSQLLPKPDSIYGVIDSDHEESFIMSVYNVSADMFEDYISKCKDAGFTVDYSQHEDFFMASNSDGYDLWLSYELGAKKMTIDLWALDDEDDEEPISTAETTEATASATEATEQTTSSTTSTEATEENKQSNDAVRPEFKEAMDSYEEFFASYCEFMKQYKENPTDLGLLTEYASFMQQYTETMNKLEELEDSDMNTAELAYYTEVMARITTMLLEVGT